MLRRFIFLESPALDQYVNALEGGRATGWTTRLMRTGIGAGGLDMKLISASGGKSREEEESKTLADTDEAGSTACFGQRPMCQKRLGELRSRSRTLTSMESASEQARREA